MTRLLIAIGLSVGVVATAAAQNTVSWGRGTGLAVAGGVAHDGDSTRAALGGAALWELTAHLALEGAGRWIDHRAADAFAGELSALIGLAGTRETAVPYVTLGVGFHRRSFDVHADTDLGGVPAFYRRRLGTPGPGLGLRRAFTDPTLVAGTGVDIALSRNVVVRPDLRVLFVVNGGRHATVTVATVNVGYRFEHKPVTPSRR